MNDDPWTAKLAAAAVIFLFSASVADAQIVRPHSLMEDAYEACERHVQTGCAIGQDRIGSCINVCLTRPGGPLCGGGYEWTECYKIAEKWLSSPDRKARIESADADRRRNDAADKAIVDQALKVSP